MAETTQFRACGADTEMGGAEQCRWRETRAEADEDLRLLRNDPFPYDHTWLESRTVTTPERVPGSLKPSVREEAATNGR